MRRLPPVQERPGDGGPFSVTAGRGEFLVDFGKRIDDLPVAELESRVEFRLAKPDLDHDPILEVSPQQGLLRPSLRRRQLGGRPWLSLWLRLGGCEYFTGIWRGETLRAVQQASCQHRRTIERERPVPDRAAPPVVRESEPPHAKTEGAGLLIDVVRQVDGIGVARIDAQHEVSYDEKY